MIKKAQVSSSLSWPYLRQDDLNLGNRNIQRRIQHLSIKGLKYLLSFPLFGLWQHHFIELIKKSCFGFKLHKTIQTNCMIQDFLKVICTKCIWDCYYLSVLTMRFTTKSQQNVTCWSNSFPHCLNAAHLRTFTGSTSNKTIGGKKRKQPIKKSSESWDWSTDNK